ncbi:hypothetical protein HYW42_03395 [Candidatus Daviesbacteria bacterium]|nr:hypothetical protein [Candidatus Daviesbacteria bacterium]
MNFLTAFRKRVFSFFLNHRLSLSKPQQIVLIATTGLLMTSAAALGVREMLIQSQTSLKAQPESKDVLAATSERLRLTGNISFNLPASFNDLIKLKSGQVVEGVSVFKGAVKFEGDVQSLEIENGTITASTITASNLVYSLTAGDGISVTTGQSPTVKNTGVLSLQSKTGALKLEEGTDITIDGLKITDKSTLSTVYSRGGCSSCITDADVAAGLTISGGTVDNSPIGATTASTGAFTTLTASSTLAVTGNLSAAAQVLGKNGSASSPSYSFTNDTDTGIYRFGANSLGIITGGSATSGLTIDSSGNVGIGTTSPSSGLDVVGSANISGSLTVLGNLIAASSGTSGYWQRSGTTISPSTSGDAITTSGNISTSGSGTITSNSLLTASNGLTLTTGALNLTSTSGQANLALTGNTNAFSINGLFGVDTTSNRVGIGTTAPTTALQVLGGNVGIGTSGAGAALQVNGGGLFGWGTASSALSSGAILGVNGNVGVGTTSPIGALHVVGQCVARGTRIRKRRKGSRGKGEDEWEDVPVEDIKPDDEVLSLNDTTGEWEWHKVEKTLNKGIQETIKIVTQSGKWIETTDEHPYLTIEKDIKPLPESGKFEVDLSTRMEKNADTFVAIANNKAAAVIKVSVKDKQSLKKLFAKSPRLFAPTLYALCIIEIIKKGKISPSQLKIDTDYLGYERRIEKLIHNFYPEIVITFAEVGHGIGSYADRAVYQAFSQKKKTGAGLNLYGFPTAEWLHHDWLHGSATHTVLTSKAYHKFTDLSMASAVWKKVKHLKPGDVIATSAGWEKVQNIYSTGRKQTYDLQIEGTHNFVGNDIVAHNTYISGNLGIGVSSPTSFALQVAGNIGPNVDNSYDLGSTSNRWRTLHVGPGSVVVHNDAADTLKATLGFTGSTAQLITDSSSPLQLVTGTNNLGLYLNTSGNVGIGKTNPNSALNVIGNVGIGTSGAGAALQVNGGVVLGWGTASVAAPSNGLAINGNLGIGTTSTNAMLDVRGSTIIAPTTNGTTNALIVRAAPGSTGNIFNLTDTTGSTSYLSVSSAGALTVGGSTLTNSGLLASSGAINLTSSANAIVGTAVEGGWTMNSNTFTYRRVMTVVNNDGSNALPSNYEVSVSLSGSTASQIYSNSQTDYDDFRIAYSTNGTTFTEVTRNVSSFTSSSVAFTFQTQASIAASGSTSNYYIYYKNSSLTCSSCTYTGNVQLDSMDSSVGSWTSADTTQFPLAQETASIYTEGTGSLKASGTVDNIGTFSTTNQNALSGARTNFGFNASSIGGTTYLYAVGGSTDGTAGNAQSTVFRTSAAAATGHVAAWTTNSNSISEARLDNSVAVATPPVDGGDGTDGAIDLTNGSGAGGCTGTGLSWSGSTCTIATATKSTFNFTTINIPSGTTLTTDGPKTTTNFVTIKATGNVTVAGTINLAGKGYSAPVSGQTAGRGPGGGACSSCQAAGGAGHGGAGGQGGGYSARTAAGATYTTDDSGSSGATGQGGVGGAGGGGIKISSGGTVIVSGTINTNGSSGTGDSNTGSGGGSGGRIALQGGTLTISGSLTANGGNGADGTPSVNYGGGGGGGGRITFEYSGSADTTGSTITVTGGNGGAGTWTATASGTAGSSGTNTSTASSPTLYVLGGKNTSGTAQSGISQGTVSSSDGSVGAFSASGTSLSQALYGHTSNAITISTTNYLYVIGGNNGTTDQTTVYKGSFSDANISSFTTTSQTQLSTGISYHAVATGSISSTNYLWVIGGLNGSTAQSTVYKGTFDASGNLTLTTTSQNALPQGLYGHQAIFATVGSNNYLYVYGGITTGGTRQTTVYKASVDASGNVGAWSTVGQTQLSTAISNFGAFNFTDSDSNQYAYIVGGNTGTAQTAVTKASYSPIDQTGYSASRTITSSNWSNKNDLQYKVYSSRTGSYMVLEYSEDGSTWQTCTFTVSSANTWETKTCDLTGVATTGRDAVTNLRLRVTSSTTTAWTAYVDDINAVTNASTISNTASSGSPLSGAANLTLNAQGTGLILLNYDATSGLAGTGGLALYNGGTSPLFSVDSSGNVGIGTTYISAKLQVKGAGTGTGISFITADSNGLHRFAILDNGNVGIGTTNPLSTFHIGTGLAIGSNTLSFSTSTGRLGIGTTSPGATLGITGNLGIGASFANSAAPSFGLAVQGNVGIGTTSPDYPLHVIGNVGIGSSLTVTGLGVLNGGLQTTNINATSLTTSGNVGVGGSITGFGALNGLNVTGLTSLAGLNASGNVGIGSSLTVTGLSVLNGGIAAPTLSLTNLTSGGALFTGPNGLVSQNIPNYYWDNTNNRLGIGTSAPGSQLAIIGNVGIGTSGAGAALQVNGGGLFGWGTASTALSSGAILGVNGNVGIGTTSPTALLQVQGSGSMPSLLVTSGGNIGIGTSVTSNPITVGTDGSTGNGAYLSTGGTWTNGSSFEFKENFESLNNLDILSKIIELDISSWNYKLEPGIKHIGPVAEQFYSVFGLGNDNKHISTIDPAGIALLGIQGLSGQINDLRIRLNESTPSAKLSLEDKIASLEARIKNLESKEGTSSAEATSSAQESSASALLAQSPQLTLTPPDVLLATGSATLANLAVTSEATFSGKLAAYNLNVSESFKVFGETSLGKTSIAGDVNIDGTMNINGNSLSVIGTLFIQNSPFSKDIDLFNGKVKIDNTGNLTVQKLTVSQKTLGTVTIPAGQNQFTIYNLQFTNKSKVFVTPEKPVAIGVSKDAANSQFTIQLDKAQSSDLKVDWWIVDVE